MRTFLVTLALLAALFGNATASYADDGGGRARPPSGDYGLMAR